MMPRFLPLLLVLVACTAEPFAVAGPATLSPSPTAIQPAAGASFVVGEGSRATVRVREQLARLNLPTDAVLTTGAVTGAFAYRPDGSFDAASSIIVDLATLASDESRRDRFIKTSTLETNRFPHAVFVPTAAEGLPNPLPREGEWTFLVRGNLTIHGVTKAVTWEMRAKRGGGELTARAATRLKFADFGMQRPVVVLVLSIEDDIRIEIDLVARETAASS